MKGRGERDAYPWWLGRGQGCSVLPTRQRVCILSLSIIFYMISALLRYYNMNHPENMVQGYSVMTNQYRYTEYVGLTE